MSIQEEEIQHLRETNADISRKLARLQQELEGPRQDRVAAQGRASSWPLLATRRSAPEEDSSPSRPEGHRPERPEVPLEALRPWEAEVRGHAGGSPLRRRRTSAPCISGSRPLHALCNFNVFMSVGGRW